MNISQRRPMLAAVLTSAMVAALVTFGGDLFSSPVEGAGAMGPAAPAAQICTGEAWPNYSAECLAAIARENGASKPDRVLRLSDAR